MPTSHVALSIRMTGGIPCLGKSGFGVVLYSVRRLLMIRPAFQLTTK